MNQIEKQAKYICPRCGGVGRVIGYTHGTVIRCVCCAAIWTENTVL